MHQTNVPFTDTKYYECHYCHQDFVPTRRHIQKYCSNSCRSKAHHRRVKKTERIPPKLNGIETTKVEKPRNKIDTMSGAGVANAAVGTAVVQAAAYLLTPEQNRSATKADLNALANKLKGRYHVIKNLHKDQFGRVPYFDLQSNNVMYHHAQNIVDGQYSVSPMNYGKGK